MKCPGQDSRYWKAGAIFEAQCPDCGTQVEFFKDDTTRRCKNCGRQFLNPGLDFGCAAYCQYAEQCIGSLPPELIAQKQDLLKDRVAIEVKRYLQKDFKRIGHAVRVARYAEEIARKEQGDLPVILCAAYLRSLSDSEGQAVTPAPDAKTGDKPCPPAVAEILTRLGAAPALQEKVCELVSREADPGEANTVNRECLLDADRIALLEERQKHTPLPPPELDRVLETSFFTSTGRELAGRRLSQ